MENSRPAYPDLNKPCLEWQGAKNLAGYGQVWAPDRNRSVGAHRVAWEEANGCPVPLGLMVLHHCDNPPCIEPSHLYVGTVVDNRKDMERRGRGLKGRPAYPRTKQPKTSLQLIREGKGFTRRTCAEGLGVNAHTWKRWELGIYAPTAASLLDIAAFLEVPAAHLRDITHRRDDGRRLHKRQT